MRILLLAMATTVALCYVAGTASAQRNALYGAGMKVAISEDGSKYIRFITWHQVWLRYNENNTGSYRNNVAQDNIFDIGLRRSRVLIYAQISPRFLIVTHFGMNNQSAVSGGYLGNDGKKPQLYMHDAYVDYKVIGNYLSVGAGLHYWNGISRITNTSTLNLLTIDAPIFNWPTIEATDQFARMLGVFAKGKLGKLDYRVAVNDPFVTNTAQVVGPAANYNPQNNSKAYQGYFKYQFLEQEPNLLPYMVGTYLGIKKVFNIGAGFHYNNNGMWRTEQNDLVLDTVKSDISLFGIDAFLDLPLNTSSGTALTAYAVYYNYDFGRNNVRIIGILNPATGGGVLRGNAFPTVGTGNILYGHAGYLLPGNTLGEKARLQPYAAFSYASFEGLRDNHGEKVPVKMLDIGANLLLEGHHSKITLNYRNRPDFTNVNNIRYKPEIILQAMVYL
ncbi:hypothetical protein ACFSKU_11135 [Pontibacter silvestris]|uniref:Short chain amide porin n=1 Tax=Pontibacter silvestris TaxID=2305183 RepID=A0ABW4WYY1_9BACT|nr:hypothetical protein [Pontibacter silvestris]MCC9138739.1 hypothetical protein [Pontibacter silvestris]